VKRKHMTGDSAEDLSPELRAVGERLRAASRPVPRDPAFTARLRADLLLAHHARPTPQPRRLRLAQGSWRLVLLAALLAAFGGGIAAAGVLAPAPEPGTVLMGREPILRTIFVGATAGAVAVDARTERAFVVTQSEPVQGRFPRMLLRVLDTTTGALLYTVALGAASGIGTSAVAVDQWAGRVFVARADPPGGDSAGVVSVLDARSGTVLRRTTLPRRPTARTSSDTLLTRTTVGIDERTGHAFIAIPRANAVAVLDTHSGALLRTIGVGLAPGDLAVDAPRGRVVVTNSAAATVSILDAGSGRVLRTVAVGAAPTAVAVDEQTGRAFVTLRGAIDRRGALVLGTGHVAVLDVLTGWVLRSVAVPATPSVVAVAEAMGHVFVAGAVSSGDGRVSMLDARTGRLLHTSTVGAYPASMAVVAHDGSVVVTTWPRPGATGRLTGVVSVIDARSGRVTRFINAGMGLLSPGPLAVDERTGQVFLASDTTVSVLDARR